MRSISGQFGEKGLTFQRHSMVKTQYMDLGFVVFSLFLMEDFDFRFLVVGVDQMQRHVNLHRGEEQRPIVPPISSSRLCMVDYYDRIILSKGEV